MMKKITKKKKKKYWMYSNSKLKKSKDFIYKQLKIINYQINYIALSHILIS